MTPREVIPAQISEEVETEVSTALHKMVDDVRRYEAFNNSSLIQQQADRIEKLEAALREIIQEDALTGKTVFVGDFGKIAIAALREKE
jgi:hypothetical protein